MAALPAKVQPERIAARFHLDPIAWFRGAEPLPSLQAVAQAVWSERHLALRYRRAGQSTLKPLKLFPLASCSGRHLVSRGAERKVDPHLSRLRRLRRRDTGRELRAAQGFRSPGLLQKASQDYEAGLYLERADVRLSPRGFARLDALGPAVMKRPSGRRAGPIAKAGCVARCRSKRSMPACASCCGSAKRWRSKGRRRYARRWKARSRRCSRGIAMLRDRAQEGLAEILELGGADAVDLRANSRTFAGRRSAMSISERSEKIT